MVAPFAAAKAYAAVQAQAASITNAAAPAAKPADGHGFADILKSAMTDAMQTSRFAENQMVANAQGKVDLIDVATAVQSAQASLQTVMAVRDQVISAYQEIMRMPI
jgi:flagellar hook-basal body complex protein FliE